MFFEKKLDILRPYILLIVCLDGYGNSHSFSLDGPYRASLLEEGRQWPNEGIIMGNQGYADH